MLPLTVALCFSLMIAPNWSFDLPSERQMERMRNKMFRTLIVGGTEVQNETYPFFVSLNFMGKFIGGGSIVSRNWLVTAAHCVYGISPEKLTIRSGTNKHATGGQLHEVEKIVMHPSFPSGDSAIMNDIALVRVKEPFDHEPITLPLLKYSYEYEPATIIGYGSMYDRGEEVETLRQASVIVMQDNACDSYGSEYDRKIMLCAAANGIDACDGDSGGPLFIRIWDKVVLVGITSFGHGCADPDYPGVYTRVTTFLPFIEATIDTE